MEKRAATRLGIGLVAYWPLAYFVGYLLVIRPIQPLRDAGGLMLVLPFFVIGLVAMGLISRLRTQVVVAVGVALSIVATMTTATDAHLPGFHKCIDDPCHPTLETALQVGAVAGVFSWIVMVATTAVGYAVRRARPVATTQSA